MQWDLHSNQPIQDLNSLCKASCIDVVSGHVSVGGYSDLREAPLLAKLRIVHNLAIDVEGLADLRGLEGIDINGELSLSTHGQDLTTFHSLEGLTDGDLEAVSIKQVLGLTEFDGARFSRLGYFSAEDSGLRRISLSSLKPEYVFLTGMSELTELSLGGGTMDQFGLFASTSLASFSWQPGLSLRSYSINNNSALSSCLVQDFIAATYAGNGRLAIASNNGPCP